MKARYYFFVILSALLLFACEQEEEIVVDQDLVPYFERFEQEAATRGVVFDYVKDRIEGHLTDIEETDVSGKCQSNSVDPDKVYIDANYWRRATDLEREFIVFHELGHCFLQREHLDDATNTGNCTSIMHSGLGTCRNAYSNNTRSAYLDELFSIN